MNMNMKIVENVYTKLNEVGRGEDVSMRFFSRTWLDKTPSYVGHKKSVGEDISHDAIFTLYGKIIAQRVDAERSLASNTEDDRELVDIYLHKIKIFRTLEHYVQWAIFENAAESQGVEL
jgi:hypothetical protein